MIEARERINAAGKFVIEVYWFGELICIITEDDFDNYDPDAPPTIT